MSLPPPSRLAKQKFTLRDVAALAGVSLKTASRVLNSEPNVQEHTAELVRKAMLRLAYRPNEMARSLKGRLSGVIGIVAPVLSHEFVAACIESAHDAANQSGRSVMLMLSNGDAAIESAQIHLLLRRQVEGLILFPSGDSIRRELAEEIGETPTVLLDIPSPAGYFPSITVENRRGARQAIEHLKSNGFESVCIVGAKPGLYTIVERLAGAKEAARECGVSLTELITDSEPLLTAPLIMSLLADATDRPAAILALNSFASEQCLHAFQGLGLRIPDDIALVGFDDFRLADVISGGITVVAQPTRDLGATAVRLILEQQTNAVQVGSILTTELIVRNSSRLVRTSLPTSESSGS